MTEQREITDQPTEADYFMLDRFAYRAMRRLRRTTRPRLRAMALTDLAETEYQHASLHTAVFGLDPYPADGCPQAEWLADSARMLWILAEAELARSQGGSFPCPGWLSCQNERTKELVAHAEAWVHCWVSQGGSRLWLYGMLVGRWGEITRGQAVESIACIPVPRWSR